MTFNELGVSAPLLRAVEALGYDQPMPIQEAVIPHLLGESRDIIALAQTGTGKTAAFGLPLLQNLDTTQRIPQALILAPTRELCVQIAGDLADYSQYMKNVGIVAVYGGASIEQQIRTIRSGVQIIVATPGRLIDLMKRGVVNLSTVRDVVLDEADEMLNMGFTESIEEILAQVPSERHLLLFSATMPKEIAAIASGYMKKPTEIVIGAKNEGNKNIRHIYYMVAAKDKYLTLKRIADYYPNIYGIIFCRTRRETQEIADKLIQDGYNADSLHGDLSQAQRDYVMQKFRIRNLQLLVATDVAARGLDVNDLTHVIHYGLPEDVESYTHRSGRTARAGKSGLSIAICHSREKGRLRDIEKIIGSQIERAYVPTGREVCERQLFTLADKIESTLPDDEDQMLSAILPAIVSKLSWIDKEELIRRFISMESHRLLQYYRAAQEVEEVPDKPLHDDRSKGSERRGRKKQRENGIPEPGYARLQINFGRRDKLYPNSLIELLNATTGGARVEVGKIDIYDTFSYFEVPERDAKTVISSMNDFEVGSRAIMVRKAQPKGGAGEKESGHGRDRSSTTSRKDMRRAGKSGNGRRRR
ncbi:DEAD/DEAH box helicase [Porphyromonas canoris]|uniref:DEAD/DEAH box helicase n=1 Tax=Porphyromonas canoris TaxID=36875 RepID=UPI00068ECEBA|nr:DEAD/DEAH box helicase [Porphyromonas canoris]